MKIGICTIQKNRAPWILEWIAFHYLFGFTNFYFFAHDCSDQSKQILSHLQKKINLKAFILEGNIIRPQLEAYSYCYSNFGNEVDWMAFIDGDEFLFPTSLNNISDTIKKLDKDFISSLAAYWSCFGSSDYVIEPSGLIIENYRYRAYDNYEYNNRVKSIVRGGLTEKIYVSNNSHIFNTPNGTFDENYNLITEGFSLYKPTWEYLRINHYITQSYSYYKNFKQFSGAADFDTNYIRNEDWWIKHNKNDIYDNSLEYIYPEIKKIISFLCK